jgi:hypothetical protein
LQISFGSYRLDTVRLSICRAIVLVPVDFARAFDASLLYIVVTEDHAQVVTQRATCLRFGAIMGALYRMGRNRAARVGRNGTRHVESYGPYTSLTAADQRQLSLMN